MNESVGLRADDISFAYGAAAPLIQGLCARFAPGTMTAVTGPSGCGKSTLLYLLGLMITPASGGIWLDDTRVDQWSDAKRAELRAHSFGFVFQDAALDPTRSVLDNVLEGALYRRSPRRVEKPKALALLERFGVAQSALHRPGEISGGQAQRIALCRALLGSPRVLLADEPTGNLDAASGAVVVTALQTLARRGGVVVVATHDDALVAHCDDVVRL